ncbi:hypothetical protein E3N88_28565 [Mikania micrantha]|uniref:Protein At-4/1 n=1 Tax=Mikania micrantha TaxID=192012 RepID=A0A5N6N1E5_9ASTR|nr:hypothetical protein E3N88_28565 [Mikania micrantha]
MAATTDEALDSLLSDFDQIHNDFTQGIVEIQTLQSNCKSEIQNREALESTANNLKSENERIMKLYTESISKLVNQLERRNNCHSLKQELKRVTDEHAKKENEFRNAFNLLKDDYENRIKELEVQIKDSLAQKVANELTINQLHQDLAAHKNHVEALAKKLDQVHSDVNMTYQYEIQDLRDCLMTEQEEKNGLNRKLESLEKELLISRTKLAENKQDSSSNRNVETLKQKVMKLRKENESITPTKIDRTRTTSAAMMLILLDFSKCLFLETELLLSLLFTDDVLSSGDHGIAISQKELVDNVMDSPSGSKIVAASIGASIDINSTQWSLST